MWTGLPVEESIRMTEDRDKWRKYVHRTASAVDSIQRSSVRLCSEWIALAVWDVRSQLPKFMSVNVWWAIVLPHALINYARCVCIPQAARQDVMSCVWP